MKKILYVVLFMSIITIILLGYSIFQSGNESNKSDTFNEGDIIKDLFLQSILNCEVELNDIYINDNESGTLIRLFDKFEDGCLVFRFYGETCSICIDDVIANLRITFPDYTENGRILLVGSNINSRLLDGYYGKRVLSVGYESLGLPSEEYSFPSLFYVDQSGISKFAFIPDKAFPELTQGYLNHIKTKYFNY